MRVLFYCFVCITVFGSCSIEQKKVETEQQHCEDDTIVNESCKQSDSLIFLTGKITQDFLGEEHVFAISDSCLSFFPNYYNKNLMFYSGGFQGEGLITILYRLDGDTAKDVLYHQGKLVDVYSLNKNLLYKIYAEDCCAGVNVKKHEFLLDPNLKCQRLHSIYAIKGTLEPRDIHKKEEFILQQDTIALRLAPTTQSEFNVDLQKEDNIIALFAKGSRGYLLADSISSTDNKHWYYVEMKDLPIPNTHYWYYEDNDSGNISYTGWIEK